jgi:hypothetical protein
MKRSTKVNEANLATILGYIKNLMNKKKTVTFIDLSVRTLKQANQIFNSNPNLNGDFGLCAKSSIYQHEMFPKPFIKLKTRNGFIGIIDVEDWVLVTASKIIIKKGFYNEGGNSMQIWSFS